MRMLILAALLIASAGVQGMAQVAFSVAAAMRVMRQEGSAEVAGDLSLSVLSPGTIQAGSTIDVIYSVPVVNNSVQSPNNITLANNVLCVGPSGGVPCPATASLVNGQVIRLTFSSNKAFAAGDAIVIRSVRVNADAAYGVGTVAATMSASSTNPVSFPITFVNAQVQVGLLSRTMDTRYGTSQSGALTLDTNQPSFLSLLTCSFPNTLSAPTVVVRVDEVFPGAFTTLAQETSLSNAPLPTNGVILRITLSYLPTGVTVIPRAPQIAAPSVIGFASIPPPVDQTVWGESMNFDYVVTQSETSVAERVHIPFTLKATSVSPNSFVPINQVGATINVQALIQVIPITNTDTIVPRFVANGIGPTKVATISDCFVPGGQTGQLTSE